MLLVLACVILLTFSIWFLIELIKDSKEGKIIAEVIEAEGKYNNWDGCQLQLKAGEKNIVALKLTPGGEISLLNYINIKAINFVDRVESTPSLLNSIYKKQRNILYTNKLITLITIVDYNGDKMVLKTNSATKNFRRKIESKIK